MDQSRYWIPKERTCLNSHVLSSFGDSWEEQAFAEDAAGPLGGCIWPPRSYTCSFCRREFRSAQALGGHMNVHRRDRARLKQTPTNNQVVEPNNNTSLGRCLVQNPNEICNPNFDLDNIALFSSSSSLRPSTPPFTCSFIQEKQKSTPILSWSKLEPQKRVHIADMGNQEMSYTKVIKSNTNSSNKDSTYILQNTQNTTGSKNDSTYILQNTQITTGSKKDSTYILQKNHQIEVHFTGNLNSRVRGRCDDTPIYNDKNEGDDALIFKRRRTDDDEKYLFPKPSTLINGDEAESIKSLKSSPNSTLENLDLELRLGDRP